MRAGGHLAAGLPDACMEVRIVDPEGRDLPADVVGEIWLRGPGVMLGYWNLPEQTAQVLHQNWMRTGDGGRLDAEGLLTSSTRLKDMIVSGGENVYSAEVENAILSLPGVAQCAVLGVPDDDWELSACMRCWCCSPAHKSTRPASSPTAKERIAGLPGPPAQHVEFRSELPVSAAGKLLKHQLRETYWQGRERRVA